MSDDVVRESSPAIIKLEAWLQKHGKTQAWLAATLGISGASVSAWFSRVSRPQTHHRETIDRITDGEVELHDWEFPAETASRRAAIERARSSEGAA